MMALDPQRDASKELDDRQAFLRLERDRLWRLRIDLPCQALDEAVDHIDSAILLLGEARRHHHWVESNL
jgi:hypothetical protein